MAYDPIHPDNPPTPPVENPTTPNYKLILMLADSITSWLNVVNTNMEKIDTAIHNVELRTSISGEVPPEAIEDIIKLNEAVKTMSEEIDAITASLNIEHEKSDDFETRIANNTSNISTLQINATANDKRITALETFTTSINDTLTKLSETVQQLNESVQSITTDIDTLDVRVTALENKEA